MRRRVLGLAFAATIGAGGITYYWSQSAAEAALPVRAAQQSVVAPAPPAKAWKTPFFASVVPEGLTVRNAREDTTRRSAIYGAYTLRSVSKRSSSGLAVSISANSAASLSEASAVKVRASQPERYRQDQITDLPAGWLSYSNLDSAELSAFHISDGQLVSVVASGLAGDRQLMNRWVVEVTSAWRWSQDNE